MSTSVVDRIRAYNADREPERLAMKYAAMRRNGFAFFRGTAHLFHEDWPTGSSLDDTPRAWVCGDLHLENFGSYRGSNGLAYFDLNDFDDAALAPCSRDLTRFITSLFLATQMLEVTRAEAGALGRRALELYAQALSAGKPGWVERSTARGMVKALLQRVKRRTRAELLAERTVMRSGRRRLRIDGRRALPVSSAERRMVARMLGRFARAQDDPGFYQVLDVARRVAGTGSLGLARFVVLVRRHGGLNGCVLLDVKRAIPSSMVPTLVGIPQPSWPSEADRVVAIQARVQAVSPALLHAVRMGRHSYILRELQPAEDRLALARAKGKASRLERALGTMAQVVAWGHVRSGGREGSAIADEWIAFSRNRRQHRVIFDYARGYVQAVSRDWREFAAAYDDRVLTAGS